MCECVCVLGVCTLSLYTMSSMHMERKNVKGGDRSPGSCVCVCVYSHECEFEQVDQSIKEQLQSVLNSLSRALGGRGLGLWACFGVFGVGP